MYEDFTINSNLRYYEVVLLFLFCPSKKDSADSVLQQNSNIAYVDSKPNQFFYATCMITGSASDPNSELGQ